LATFDWALNNGMPVVIIVMANVALIARVIRQKRRCHRAISWQKQRYMTLQLLSISCLYLIAWLPNTISAVMEEVIGSDFIDQIQTDYIFDLLYLVCLLVPWVYLGMLPGLRKWIWKPPNLQHVTYNAVVPLRIAHVVIK
jgi:hypothetical protein